MIPTLAPVRFGSLIGGSLFLFSVPNGTVWAKNDTTATMIGWDHIWESVNPDKMVHPVDPAHYTILRQEGWF